MNVNERPIPGDCCLSIYFAEDLEATVVFLRVGDHDGMLVLDDVTSFG
jgi:hypothetical protein